MDKKSKGEWRAEYDSFGRIDVPADSYWGAHTQRAVENFNVSDFRIPKALVRAFALVKWAAADAHEELGVLEKPVTGAVKQAAEEMEAGKFDDQFPVDVFQTGSGTSWNMNVNEVLSRRAEEILSASSADTPDKARNRASAPQNGRPEAGYRGAVASGRLVHPNDVVNKSQSSNDVVPSAINIATVRQGYALVDEIQKLLDALKEKEGEFAEVIKLGRTHLQDAVPMTFGQEISGWKEQLRFALHRLEASLENAKRLPLGGTAIGTGLNATKNFSKRAIEKISVKAGVDFREAPNKFAGIAGRDESLEVMSSLNGIAVVYTKIAQDLRLLSSGPRAGLGELTLPPLQPGSSIMPGKVNPVIPEMVLQTAVFVMGKHTSVSIAASHAPLELNIMQPLIAHELIGSLELLRRTSRRLRKKAIEGMRVDAKRCRRWVEESLALVTPLAERIGYDRAAEIAHRAYSEGKSLFDVADEEAVLTEEELRRVLDPNSMSGPS